MTDTPRSRLIPKLLLSYAFTFMLIELADSLSILIDGIIVSQSLGATVLAGIGLADPSFKMIFLFCGIIAVGIQYASSSAMGAGDRDRIDRCFSSGAAALALIAVLLTVFGYACLKPLCRIFGADGSDPALYAALHDYLRGWFAGIPGFVGFTSLSPVVSLDGNKRCVTIATVVQGALNLAGDLLATRVLHTGAFGVGLSTGLSFDIAFLVLMTNFLRKRSSFRFVLSKVDLRSVPAMLRPGLPKLTKYGCKLLSPILINNIVLSVGGSAAMAAMAVKNSIGNFFLVAGQGIAESVGLLSQVYYSEKDVSGLRQTANSAFRLNLVICSALSLLQFIGSGFIASLYMQTGTAEYALTVRMMHFFAFSVMLNGLNAILMSYLQGTRHILPTHLHTATHRLLALAVMTFVLSRFFGTDGLFIAMPAAEALTLLLYVALARLRGRNRSFADSLLLIPEGFAARRDALVFSVTTLEEVMGVSERVGEFCSERGIDSRRTYFASLCVEELVSNVVTHGFTKDTKAHSCDVFVAVENGDIVLRIRDDCRFFDIKARYESMDKTDPAAHIGIRLVYKIAKDVRYISILNTNTLLIRV